jgi:hypothetical protein
VVPNPVQIIAAPIQPPQVVPNPVQIIAEPIKPPQVVQNPVQIITAPIEVPKTAVIVPSIVRQRTPEPAAEFDDIPELEDDSNPTSPEPPTLLQRPLPQQVQVQVQVPQQIQVPQQVQVPQQQVPPQLQAAVQRLAVKKKIVGFGSKDIEAAVALKRQLEEQDKAKLQHEANKKRLAELEAKGLLEYRKRTTSSSSDSSNYDTPPGSPAAAAVKEKGKLKKNLEQVTNALSFSFGDSRNTRSSTKKKEGKGWPPKS